MLGDSVEAGPVRVLLLSGDYRTARLVDQLVHRLEDVPCCLLAARSQLGSSTELGIEKARE